MEAAAEGFGTELGKWATSQPFNTIVIILVIILAFTTGPKWFEVVSLHVRECRKINNDEQHRRRVTAREIKEKRAKIANRSRRSK